MIHVTASDFKNKVGKFQDRALVEPIAITKHGDERLVLISFTEYERLKRRDREVLSTADLDRTTIEAIARAEAPKEAKKFDHEVEE